MSDEIGNDGLTWPHTFDGHAWARQFVQAAQVNPGLATDLEAIIGWFANAIMIGHDAAARRAFNTIMDLTNQLAALQSRFNEYKIRLEVLPDNEQYFKVGLWVSALELKCPHGARMAEYVGKQVTRELMKVAGL